MIGLIKTQNQKSFLYLAVFILSFLTSILWRNFSPPPCTAVVEAPLKASIVINCDSAQFMQDSQNPSRLLEAQTSYQDRPLYSLTARLFSNILTPIVPQSREFHNAQHESIQFQYANFISFILLHSVVVLIGLFFLHRALPWLATVGQTDLKHFNNHTLLLYSLSTLIFLNDITKGFFWTPHTQVFNLFLISFSLYSVKFFSGSNKRWQVGLWFIAAGTLVFFYPLMVLLLVIPTVINLRKYLLLSVATLVPYLIYPQILENFGGTYRNPQTADFKQFVWLFEIDEASDVLNRIDAFLHTFPKTLTICTLILAAFVTFKHRKKLAVVDFSYFLFLFSYFSFLFLMGFYANRLTSSFVIATFVYFVLIAYRYTPRKVTNRFLTILLILVLFSFLFTQGSLS